MQTLRIVLTLSYLRAKHDALRETFLKVTDNEMYTAKRPRTSYRRPLRISNNCRFRVLERIVGRGGKKITKEGWREEVS